MEPTKKLKNRFCIVKQVAENLGRKEMTSGIIAGLHSFAKEAELFFKDINSDTCIIGTQKIKIFTRDAHADEDILIPDVFFKNNPDVDLYMCCKIKANEYWYVGYVNKSVVASTRTVQMIGQDSEKESKDIRRIFAEQYKPISDIIPLQEEELEEQLEIVEQKYVPLHFHSEFSVGDAFGSPKVIAKALHQKGFKSAALTDHGTLAGVWEFQKAMLEYNLKPIIGVEFYVKIPETEKRTHLVVLVINETGWKNLLKIQSISVRENFYYKPVVPIDVLLENSEGLIVTAACIAGPIHMMLEEKKYDVAEKYLGLLKEKFKDNFYGEIQPHIATPRHQEIMQEAYALYKKHNVEMIFSTDAHFCNKDEIEVHKAIKAINWKKKFEESGFGDDCFYLMTDDDIEQRINSVKENNWMLDIIEELKSNTIKISEKIEFQFEPVKIDDTLPKLMTSQEERKQEIKKLCIEGLKNTKYEYVGNIKDRLDLEIDRILSKGYENYFLIVYHMIKWAKENKIMCGPGRGSVGASLAAYCLGITDCDPIKFDLLFDRFLSEIRRDMPDVDMDFQDSRRQEVFQYLRDTYGKNHCAKVSTYSRFKPKGIIRDIGRIFSLPFLEIEKICSLVIERSGGDARASFGLMDTFEEFEEAKEFQRKYPKAVEIAIKLEGTIRHKGIHAAAMVVTEEDVSSYVPINQTSGEIVVEWEKQLAEDAKLIKFDILGLKTLSVISECINDTGVLPPQEYEDEKVYEKVFINGKTLGIFQFETVGLSKLSSTLNCDDFQTLHDTTTLFRPGALHSGQTMMYVNRRLGKEKVTYEHPKLENISKDTKGIILYQEQIMQIMNQIGGMSWATAEMARKVITKSKGKKAFEEMRSEFVRNAERLHNTPKEEAEKLYDVVSTFGSYSFNKAHAVEYSIISYWCAWYKTFYPVQFYKAILKFEDCDKQISSYVQEAESEGVQIEYPHINHSHHSYCIKDDVVFSGFNSIKGIGEKTSQKIVKNQPYNSFEEFLKKIKPSPKLLKSMIVADCFRDFNINKKICCGDKIDGMNFYDKLQKDFDDIEYAQLIFSLTNLKPKIDILKAYDFPKHIPFVNISDFTEEHSDQMVYIRGVVTETLNKDKLLRGEIKNHEHKFENHMIYLNINDGTGDMACQVNPWTYDKYKHFIHNLDKKPVLIYGKAAKNGQKIYAEIIQPKGENKHVTDFFSLVSNSTKEQIVVSSTPAVSKNGKSYYRLTINDGTEGLLFQLPIKKIYAGLKVKAFITKKPFLNLVIKDE